jgi:hypothetical protein
LTDIRCPVCAGRDTKIDWSEQIQLIKVFLNSGINPKCDIILSASMKKETKKTVMLQPGEISFYFITMSFIDA